MSSGALLYVLMSAQTCDKQHTNTILEGGTFYQQGKATVLITEDAQIMLVLSKYQPSNLRCITHKVQLGSFPTDQLSLDTVSSISLLAPL